MACRLMLSATLRRRCASRVWTSARRPLSSGADGSSVDRTEVAKFAEAWSHPDAFGSSVGPLRVMNQVRVEALRSFLLEGRSSSDGGSLTGMRAVDVGCGMGLLSESLAALGMDVQGVDASAEAIAAATRRADAYAAGDRLRYRVGTAEDLVLEERCFELVCSLEVIEHVRDPEAFLRDLCAMVEPGGTLVLSTMNRTAKSWLMAILGAEYVAGMLPVGTHDWARFVRPADVERALRREGLRTERVQGMVFDPRQLTWALSEDASVNYILFARKPRST